METPKILTGLIIKEVERKYADHIPDVEGVQDIVEKVLIEEGHSITAKAYIIYREKEAKEGMTKRLLSAWTRRFPNISTGGTGESTPIPTRVILWVA